MYSYSVSHRKRKISGTTVDTTNLQPGELIHMEYSFYNYTSIRGFTSVLTAVCEKTRMIWVFPTASKTAPLYIINFILKKLNNEQHPCKFVRVNKDVALEKSTDVTSLMVDDFIISMENTGGNTSWLNGKIDRQTEEFTPWLGQVFLTVTNTKQMLLCIRNTSRSVTMQDT